MTGLNLTTQVAMQFLGIWPYMLKGHMKKQHPKTAKSDPT